MIAGYIGCTPLLLHLLFTESLGHLFASKYKRSRFNWFGGGGAVQSLPLALSLFLSPSSSLSFSHTLTHNNIEFQMISWHTHTVVLFCRTATLKYHPSDTIEITTNSHQESFM